MFMFVDLCVGEWVATNSYWEKNKKIIRVFWSKMRKYFKCSKNSNITAWALI